jgi:hypothetical protein
LKYKTLPNSAQSHNPAEHPQAALDLETWLYTLLSAWQRRGAGKSVKLRHRRNKFNAAQTDAAERYFAICSRLKALFVMEADFTFDRTN